MKSSLRLLLGNRAFFRNSNKHYPTVSSLVSASKEMGHRIEKDTMGEVHGGKLILLFCYHLICQFTLLFFCEIY